MDDGPSDSSSPAPAPPAQAGALADLYCPACAYPLRGVEEAGLDCCPECGTPVDLAELRRIRTTGLDLARYPRWRLPWRLLWKPAAFLGQLRGPQHHLMIEREWLYVAWAGAIIAASALILAGCGLWATRSPFAAIVCAGYVLLMVIVHGMALVLLKGILRKAGHAGPARAARRIMYLASSLYIPIALNLLCLAVAMAVPLVFGVETWSLTVRICSGLFFPALHFLLWRDWTRALNLLANGEIYGSDPARLRALWLPGGAMAAVGTVLLCSACGMPFWP